MPSWAPDVVGLFTELAAIPSPPGSEREVADRVRAYLEDLGLDVSEDDAGPRIGSNAGNLLCRIPASSANGGVAIFLCAHLDTVPPTGPLEPVVEDGVVRNAGAPAQGRARPGCWGRRAASSPGGGRTPASSSCSRRRRRSAFRGPRPS